MTLKIRRRQIIDYIGKEHLEQTKSIKGYTNKELKEIFLGDIKTDTDYLKRMIKVT